jgi:hypothetical protein
MTWRMSEEQLLSVRIKTKKIKKKRNLQQTHIPLSARALSLLLNPMAKKKSRHLRPFTRLLSQSKQERKSFKKKGKRNWRIKNLRAQLLNLF